MDRREMLRILSGSAASMVVGRVLAVDKPAEAPKGPFDGAKIATEKLRDNLYAISGPGGNMAVLFGDDGGLLVDCGVSARAKGIKAAIAELSPKPLRTLVNTHWHFDHTGGNEFFGKAGLVIVAHENCRKRLSTEQNLAFLNMKFPPSPAVALPVVTFNDSLTLYRNGEELHIVAVPPAHTDGDAILHYRKANVIHMGDLFFNGMYPVIDPSSNGTIDGMVGAIDRALKMADADTKIIPGHGAIASSKELKEARDLLVTIKEAVAPLVKAGKTLDEVIAAKPTKTLDDKYGKGFVNSEMLMRMVYPSIKAGGEKSGK